jgi:hypothetical protein
LISTARDLTQPESFVEQKIKQSQLKQRLNTTWRKMGTYSLAIKATTVKACNEKIREWSWSIAMG